MESPVRRVVFLDVATFGNVSLKGFSERWDCTVHDLTAPEEVSERVEGFDGVVVNKVRLDKTLLNSPAAADIRLIAEAATGTDNVDLEAAKSRGIYVCNVPGYATQSVAQFAIALILELATRAGAYAEIVRRGAWQQSPMYTRMDFSTAEVSGKKLGIIGYGSIGRRVAEMARGLGMEVLISARPGSSGPVPAGRLAVDDLLASSDFVSLHCPLTAETRSLINSRVIGLMKPAAFLINTARGALIDETALIAALRTKRLAGAALDVISQEPPSDDHPIIRAAHELENLIVTPHCAWTAREARQRLMNEVAENILAFCRGERRNSVV
ncbi:MAG: D-2-hydroxyacid dehydrogenase [Deltaproteobacteria bacterium]|nr:D-2-hydroxyacid dehydrogenase [Deltaproteobacteria bacterium]